MNRNDFYRFFKNQYFRLDTLFAMTNVRWISCDKKQGVRLTEDADKKRTDGGEKRGEKKGEKRGEKSNNRLAGRVIQYSQFGSLVLQSVKVAAAGKYACRATNGIDDETVGNKTMSNTVRLYVKRKYLTVFSIIII